MFRCLNDVLSIQQNESDISKIINDSDSAKEKFILGLKFIYTTEEKEIGLQILKSIERIDTSAFIEPSFIKELFDSQQEKGLRFGQTLKIVLFILKNASHKGLFEMAIHQHLSQYVQKTNIDTSNLSEILDLIKIITGLIKTRNFNGDFMEKLCKEMIKAMSQIPVPREAENIQTMKVDSVRIIEFFEQVQQVNQYQIAGMLLKETYELITRNEEISALTCLTLSVVPEFYIPEAVTALLNATRQDDKQSVLNAINRLILWQRTICFNVPLHLWIVRILTILSEQKQEELLHEIIKKNFAQSIITLILPALQKKTFMVVQTMFELQRSNEIFQMVAPRIHPVLLQLSNNKSDILDPFMDVVSDYISSFSHASLVCPEVVNFLESHDRATTHSNNKYRRLSQAKSLSNNVRIGLENLGNTCYMNSVIQALFMTKSFCRELLTTKETQDRASAVMQKIFGLLLFSERSELNLKFAMPHIRPNDFVPGLQHDSSEFMGNLLDKLHEADKKMIMQNRDWDDDAPENENASITNRDIGVKLAENDETPMELEHGDFMAPTDTVIDNTSEVNQETIVQKIFGGKTTTTCVCSLCKSKSIRIDSFRDLALSFPEKDKNEDADIDAEIEYSVQKLLDFYFTTEQLTLEDKNQYQCEHCKVLCDGVRCTEMLQPPRNLILTLKHFSYDSMLHTRSKLLLNKMIHDEVISVKVRPTGSNNWRIVKYRLYAAVVHSGFSLDSGHYYTFAREKEDTWYKFNDSYVSTSTLHELHNLNSPNTPYIMFYRRISTASATASSAEACSSDQLPNDEDKLPSFCEIPPIVRSFISDDNAEHKKESKKFLFQQNKPMSTPNRWNDDDPPSSCGSNFDVPRYIY